LKSVGGVCGVAWWGSGRAEGWGSPFRVGRCRGFRLLGGIG
jgi:hypothetical protein